MTTRHWMASQVLRGMVVVGALISNGFAQFECPCLYLPGNVVTITSGAPVVCTTTLTLGCTPGDCFLGKKCEFTVTACGQAGGNCCNVVAWTAGGGTSWIQCTPLAGPGLKLGELHCSVLAVPITFGATDATCAPGGVVGFSTVWASCVDC